MSEPLYFLQIVDRNGTVATLPGGGPLEAELVRVLTDTIVAKGVGFFKTEAAVKKAIEEGVHEALMALKRKTIHLVR